MKRSRKLELALIPFAIVGLVQLGFWIDRRVPVTVHQRIIETASIQPGEEFTYENVFTRNKYCETRVDRWFVGSDDIRREIDPLPAAMPTEGLNQRQRSTARIRVPRDMPPGASKSCFQSTWQCNPVQVLWPLRGPETCIDFNVEMPPLSIWFLELPVRVAHETEP